MQKLSVSLLAIGSLCALGASASLRAQSTIVLPAGFENLEGGQSSTIPWQRVGVDTRVQYMHDPRDFTDQGVSYPIVITGLAWRANGGVNTGGANFPSSIVNLSTAATSWQNQDPAYDLNHGPDKTQVYSGSVLLAVPPGTTPNSYYAGMTFTTPFTYNPLNGADLVIEAQTNGLAASGQDGAVDFTNALYRCSRIWDLSLAPATTGNPVQLGQSSPMRLTYQPAPGLWAGFKQNLTAGADPLSVQFTDTSVTDNVSGVINWVWDFGDGGTSSLQNPSHVYTVAGVYSVSLQVFDANGFSTFTKTDLITVGAINADFRATEAAPNNVWAFTDLTTGGTVDQWEWDFDNDGTVDSTLPSPVWVFPTAGPYTVKLTTYNNVGGFVSSRTKADWINSKLNPGWMNTGGGTPYLDNFGGNFMDFKVKTSTGLRISSLDIHFRNGGVPATVSVYVTDTEYANKDTLPAAWRLVSTGSIASTTGQGTLDNVDVSDFYLPQGNYGMAIYSNGGGLAYSEGQLDGRQNASLELGRGRARTGLFGGTVYTNRAWNGAFYWQPFGSAAYGFFAPGCTGSNNLIANQSVADFPHLGAAFTVTVGQTPPNSIGVMVTGLANDIPGLPLDLGALGITPAGCMLRVSPEVTSVILSDAAGNAPWTLQVPNSPLWLGVELFNQALILDASFAPALGVVSDAWGGVVGS